MSPPYLIMAVIRKKERVLVRTWRKGKPWALLWESRLVYAVETGIEGPQKIKNRAIT